MIEWIIVQHLLVNCIKGISMFVPVEHSSHCLTLSDENMSQEPILFQRDHFSSKNFFFSVTSEQSFFSFVDSHPGAGIPPTLVTPSLPEESQTTEDLLDRI